MSPIISTLTSNWTSIGSGGNYWIATVQSNLDMFPKGIGLDNNDNAYMVATAETGSSQYMHLLVKFNSDGSFGYQRGLATGQVEYAEDCAGDTSGNMYVGGVGSIQGYNSFIAKYNSSGTVQWKKQIRNSCWLHCVKTANSGNQYYVGYIEGSNWPFNANDKQGYILKVNSSGVRQWDQLWYNGESNHIINPRKSLAIDSSENIYVAWRSKAGRQYAVQKLNSSGTVQWSIGPYIGSGQTITPYALDIDSSGNVFVVGRDNTGGWQTFVTKFNNSGTQQWSRKLDNCYVESCAVDSAGNVYATGRVNTSPHGIFVAKWNNSGTLQWKQQITTNVEGYAYDISIDSNDELLIAGTTKKLVSGKVSGIVIRLPNDGSISGTYSHWTIGNL